MSRPFESLGALPRLAVRTRTAIAAIAHGFVALIAEHSRALLASARAALPRGRLADLRAMYTSDPNPTGDRGLQESGAAAAPLQGQLLRLSERREVAIYLREDELWVADFIDGQGELVDAATWFRFHCATAAASHARRRMIRESAIPLSAQLAARIESLHCSNASAETNA